MHWSYIFQADIHKPKKILRFHCKYIDLNLFSCRYSTFVNWELWWPEFPILVYFKETQTKPDGQVHFFPVIFVSTLCCELSVDLSAAMFGCLNSIWTWVFQFLHLNYESTENCITSLIGQLFVNLVQGLALD